MNWKTTASAIGLALLASTGLARAEGELHIYNWGNYTSPDVIKKFEEKYNVKVTITDFDSNDTAIAKVRQGGHGFDIAIPSQTYVPIWIEEGLAQQTDPYTMENFKNVAEEWKNPDFDPGRKYTVPWAWGTIGVVVNTKVYSGPSDTWGILFDTPDELKGKVNVVPEMNDVMFAAIKYLGGEQCTDDKELLKKVRDMLLAAKPNWIAMEYNTIERMGAGDFAATSDWNGSALRQRLAHPEIKFFYPKEGYGLWSDNVLVLKEAKNVENAKLFQNFIMDPEIAAGLSAFHRYANGIAGSDKYMPEDMKDAPEVVIPEEVKARGELQQMCPPQVQEIYTRIWTELQK